MSPAKTKKPVYTVIYESICRRIFSGDLRPGDLLESENQLCETYHVSRETVRKALKMVENDGLIYSRPKVGYFISTPNHGNFNVSFQEENEQTNSTLQDIQGIRPTEELQRILGVSANQMVIRCTLQTLDADEEPISYDVEYIPYEKKSPNVEKELRFAVFPDLTLSKISTFACYSEVEIRAMAADEELAEVLHCEKGAPLLLVEQLFIKRDGQKVALARHYGRADRISLKGVSGHPGR